MKCQIPQISWHGRDPILSIDFQPGERDVLRLATGGTDSHVLIWYIIPQENSALRIECASDLFRHNKSVNVVRFSPGGDFLASGDDEGAIFVWQQKERDSPPELDKDDDGLNQEEWYTVKLLRGHLEDVYDLSWSPDGSYLVSGSMDNTTVMWDMQKYQKVHIFSEFKGYVQGVAWDPLNSYIAAIGTDRALRLMSVTGRKCVAKIQRAPWHVTTEKGSTKARLFYDDTLQSYFRRLAFTPDGEFLIVPSGIIEGEEKLKNTVYVFSRHAPKEPVMHLPTGDKYTVGVRCNPLLYKLRGSTDADKENASSKRMLDLPYRMIFAVATCDSILLYDTEQMVPFAYISNIHYTHLTDMSWSSNGKLLVASSSDGYCSIIIFNDELGEVYVPPPPPVPEEVPVAEIPEPPITQVTPVNTAVGEEHSEANKTVVKQSSAASPQISNASRNTPKSNRKAKPYSIKNFFISPKASNASLSVNKPSEDAVQSADNRAPLPDGDLSPVRSTAPEVPCSNADTAVEDNSVEFLFATKSEKPKCKTQLELSFENAAPKLSADLRENETATDMRPLQSIYKQKDSTEGEVNDVSSEIQPLLEDAGELEEKIQPGSGQALQEPSTDQMSKPSTDNSVSVPETVKRNDGEMRPASMDIDHPKETESGCKSSSEDAVDFAIPENPPPTSSKGPSEDSDSDWKLEFSEDEASQMEIDVTLVSKPAPSKVVSAQCDKPKKRISFVTLSNKSSVGRLE